MKLSGKKALTVVLSVFLTVSAVMLAVFVYKYIETNNALEAYRHEQQQLTVQSEQSFNEIFGKLLATEAERGEIQKKLDEIEVKLDGAYDQYLEIEGEREELIEQIHLLRDQLDKKTAEVDYLSESLEKYNKVYSIDVLKQTTIINKILELLKSGAPLRKIEHSASSNSELTQYSFGYDNPRGAETSSSVKPSDTVNANAAGTAAENKSDNPADTGGEEIDPDSIDPDSAGYEYIYPKIALYYEDIFTGYKLAYNETSIFYSASIIKQPYILWLLQKLEDEENRARDRAEESREELLAQIESGFYEGKEDEIPEVPEFIFTDEKWDVSRIFVYDETKKQEGSGIIKNSADGAEYTYLELIRHAIMYSDNVAFAELRRVYGYSEFNSFSSKLKVKSVVSRFNNMTAGEAGIYLRATYDYLETGSKYAVFLKDWMRRANHSVLIPSAVSPKVSVHKYGWDINAYHDMAVVFDSKPYLLVIFTDMDMGSGDPAVDAYIKSIVRLIDQLHTNFYK